MRSSKHGGSMPTDMAFIAMSKDAGEILESVVIKVAADWR